MIFLYSLSGVALLLVLLLLTVMPSPDGISQTIGQLIIISTTIICFIVTLTGAIVATITKKLTNSKK